MKNKTMETKNLSRTQVWKEENKEYYQSYCRRYSKTYYQTNTDVVKKSQKEWAENNPDKVKTINDRKNVLYKKLEEILSLNNSKLLQKYSLDELYFDLTERYEILFYVPESEKEEYEYSEIIGRFYYRRNFYVFLAV